MSFNPDLNKQTQEVIFSRKSKRLTHPPLVFYNNNVSQAYSQNHLGVILDFKVTFEEHLINISAKVSKAVVHLRKLCNILPRTTLITICKAFIWSHLDYCDVLYDQAFNNVFKEKLESFQYNACLALTGAIRGTSKEKIYQELGLESLRYRRWYRKLCLFYKILENKNPKYLFSLIPTRRSLSSARNIHNIPLVNTKHNFFKNSFFLSTIIEWNNLDPHLRKSENFLVFKSNILKFIRPSPNSVYNCHNPRGICLITRLRLGLSHLREHKFKHGFQDMLNPLCSCGNDVESTEHFLLHCPQFVNERRTLLSTLGNFNCSLLENTSKVLTQTLLLGNTSLSENDNSKILSAAIDFILSTKRFDEQLFQIIKVVSTDHNQTNIMTSLIICFSKNQIYF